MKNNDEMKLFSMAKFSVKDLTEYVWFIALD